VVVIPGGLTPSTVLPRVGALSGELERLSWRESGRHSHWARLLPVPRREQSFKDRDDKRRAAILEKHRYGFNYEMVFNPLS